MFTHDNMRRIYLLFHSLWYANPIYISVTKKPSRFHLHGNISHDVTKFLGENQLAQLWLIHTARERDRYKVWTDTIEKQRILVLSVSRTSVNMVLYFPFGPCTASGLVPVQCESTITVTNLIWFDSAGTDSVILSLWVLAHRFEISIEFDIRIFPKLWWHWKKET